MWSIFRIFGIIFGMASSVNGNFSTSTGNVDQFFEKHFTKIAFMISTLALLILSPLSLLIGAAIGFAIHFYAEPNLSIKSGDSMITIPNAVFSVVGAVASLIRLTPAGALGGHLFQAIPFISSFAVGGTAYRISNFFSAK